MSTSGSDNVVRFKRPIHMNIGIVVCGIIFVYVLFHLLSYYTTQNITIYEVKSGSLVSDHEYRAFAIREEMVVNTDTSGFLYYFASDDSRVGVRSQIYCVDETGSIIETLTAQNKDDMTQLSESALKSTEGTIAAFTKSFDAKSYQSAYAFKNNLSDMLNALYVDTILSEHADEIAAASSQNTYHSYYAPTPGLVSYTIDGYEGTTKDTFTGDVFADTGRDAMNLKGRTEVEAEDAAYKLVTSDNWSLIIEADDELVEQIGDRTVLEITFEQDQTSAWATISYMDVDDAHFLVMDFDDSMERYANERFIDISLNLNEEKGLKIPNSAIVEKNFFAVPKTFFLQGNDSSDLGVLLRGDGGDMTFMTLTIYYETEDAYYIDNEKVHKGDVIVAGDSAATYTIGTDTAPLSGVYNVNKGYAIFKQIEILYQSDDYTIIKSGTAYGIALYDHIALQGNDVKENDIIHP